MIPVIESLKNLAAKVLSKNAAEIPGNTTDEIIDYMSENYSQQSGTPGAAAGFGTPTATVDANTGTPSVTVTASGPDTAKVFAFTFKNLKGAKGDKGDTGATGAPGAGLTGSASAVAAIATPESADAATVANKVNEIITQLKARGVIS